jgi:predicted nucleic acid-binding protein
MKPVFVDTGAWYALLDAKDPDHARVVPCFRDFQGRLATSNFVVDEILTLARFRLGWSVAHRLGAQLRSGRLSRVERISPKDEETAWSIFSSYDDKSFSFTNCTSFALVQRLKLPSCLAIDADFRSFGLHCIPALQ